MSEQKVKGCRNLEAGGDRKTMEGSDGAFIHGFISVFLIEHRNPSPVIALSTMGWPGIREGEKAPN